jgi:hypothetical protein
MRDESSCSRSRGRCEGAPQMQIEQQPSRRTLPSRSDAPGPSIPIAKEYRPKRPALMRRKIISHRQDHHGGSRQGKN